MVGYWPGVDKQRVAVHYSVLCVLLCSEGLKQQEAGLWDSDDELAGSSALSPVWNA